MKNEERRKQKESSENKEKKTEKKKTRKRKKENRNSTTLESVFEANLQQYYYLRLIMLPNVSNKFIMLRVVSTVHAYQKYGPNQYPVGSQTQPNFMG